MERERDAGERAAERHALRGIVESFGYGGYQDPFNMITTATPVDEAAPEADPEETRTRADA